MKTQGLEKIDWAKMDGLVPVVVQDAASLQVLMLGYMNADAVERTLMTGKVTFFSRSKGRLWEKGETSGNALLCRSIEVDCDSDALLVTAEPKGPTCHRGSDSCFTEEKAPALGFLAHLSGVIEGRYRDRPEGSYTTKLFSGGINRMAQKVGEEGVEVALASKDDDLAALKGEAADLIFHLMVLLRAKGIGLLDIVETLRSRHS